MVVQGNLKWAVYLRLTIPSLWACLALIETIADLHATDQVQRESVPRPGALGCGGSFQLQQQPEPDDPSKPTEGAEQLFREVHPV